MDILREVRAAIDALHLDGSRSPPCARAEHDAFYLLGADGVINEIEVRV